nr:hypothetical protein [Tanacetum cinerariifolium]
MSWLGFCKIQRVLYFLVIRRKWHQNEQPGQQQTGKQPTPHRYRETTNTTSVTNAQLQAMVDQGVTATLAAHDALRSTNGDDSHNSRMGVKRTERATRECTYTDFLKCQPLHFKATEGELALLCGRMFSEESDKIEKYIGGLPDMIHGSVVASKPKIMEEANTGRVYTAASGERKEYVGTLPLCNKCKFHHNGQCTIKYANCKRVGHLTRDCRSPAASNNHRNPTCYECRNQGHYRSDCPELKNQDHGN